MSEIVRQVVLNKVAAYRGVDKKAESLLEFKGSPSLIEAFNSSGSGDKIPYVLGSLAAAGLLSAGGYALYRRMKDSRAGKSTALSHPAVAAVLGGAAGLASTKKASAVRDVIMRSGLVGAGIGGIGGYAVSAATEDKKKPRDAWDKLNSVLAGAALGSLAGIGIGSRSSAARNAAVVDALQSIDTNAIKEQMKQQVIRALRDVKIR